jgi:hypothetical protein
MNEEVEQVEQAEAVVDQTVDQVTDDKPQWQTKVDKRIGKLTAEKYELKSELAAIKAKMEMYERFAAPQQPQATGKPQRDDYVSDDEFIEALTDYKLDLKEKELLPKLHKQREEQQRQEQVKSVEKNFQQRINEARTKYRDFEEVVDNPDILLSTEIIESIKESDLSGDLLYYLGKNPAEAERLSYLSARAVGRELGKLEVKLATPQQNKSKAPDPIVPARNAKTVTGRPDPMTAKTADEYYRLRFGA